MLAQQNFSRAFTTVFEPFTPIRSINALAMTEQSGENVPPPGWSVSTGSVPFINNGVQKYWKLRTDTSGLVHRMSSPVGSYTANFGTNGGMTYVVVARMNSTSATSINGSLFGGTAVGGITPYYGSSAMVYAINQEGAFPQSQTVNKNKFMVFTYVFTNQGQLNTYYVDGFQGVSRTTTLTARVNTVSSATAQFNLRVPSATVASDTDVMYACLYDRPLTPSQVRRIFNSFAPVLEHGTISPVFAPPATQFTSIAQPAGALFVFNAYLYSATNGQSYAPGSSGWIANNVATPTFGVDALDRRFVNIGTNFSRLEKSFTVNSAMSTNGGYSFVMMMRINSRTPTGQSPLFSVGLAELFLNLKYTQIFQGSLLELTNMYHLASYSPLGGQIPTDSVSTTTDNVPLSKFFLLCITQSGTTSRLFINNQVFATRLSGITPVSGMDRTGYTTVAHLGLNHTDAVNPVNNVDISYASFFDRPLNTTELNNLFNSVSMIVDP